MLSFIRMHPARVSFMLAGTCVMQHLNGRAGSSRDTKNALDRNDHQFCHPFDFHHDEGISVHAAVGEVDDLSRKEVITIQVEKHLGGISMVEIAKSELEYLASPI